MAIRSTHISLGHVLSEGARHKCPQAALRELLDDAVAHGAGWGATHVSVVSGPHPLFDKVRERVASHRAPHALRTHVLARR